MYSLAIYREGSSWKVALLTEKEKIPQIVLLRTLGIEEHPLPILKPLLEKKSYILASALDADKVLLRTMKLEITGFDKVLAALPFQAEDSIPFSKEETLLCPFLLEEDKQSTTVRLVATKRDSLTSHISFLNESGIDPHFVTTTIHALRRWARFAAPKEPALFIAYISRQQCLVAYLKDEEIVECKAFSLDNLGEWQRVKKYFSSMQPEDQTIPWIVAGQPQIFSEQIPSIPVSESLQTYAIPIGIGLEALADDKRSVQWRKEELLPASTKLRRRKKFVLTLAFLLGSFCLFGPLGHTLLRHHQGDLSKRAAVVLEKLGTPVKQMDMEEMIEILLDQKAELEKEKHLGPHFPMLSCFLLQLSQASLGIDKKDLPFLTSLHYDIGTSGKPKLEMEWSIPSKEAAQYIKTSLSRMKELKIEKWHLNAEKVVATLTTP